MDKLIWLITAVAFGTLLYRMGRASAHIERDLREIEDRTNDRS